MSCERFSIPAPSPPADAVIVSSGQSVRHGRRGGLGAARLDEALASFARQLGADIAAVPPFVTLLC